MLDKKGKEYLQAIARLEVLGRQIKSATTPVVESQEAKQKRLKRMLNNEWEGFNEFAHYYFGEQFMDAEFGWFHKEAFKGYSEKNNYKGVWEWSRNHAKSVFLIMIALYDKARNTVAPDTFRGLVLASQTDTMACELLGAIQMQLQNNERYIADFGTQFMYGDWADGNFSTQDGCGFWAFGLGQNPAGIRKGAKRPTHIFADDCDNYKNAENQLNVERNINWINGELMGVCDIRYGKKFVYVNNRVHRRGITAHMAGDVEDGDKVHSDIHHIKVYITENPQTHEKLYIEAGGVPAWKERYTIEMVDAMIKDMGGVNAERQLYHNHVERGHVFKKEQIEFVEPLPLTAYDALVSYADMSYKDTKKNDFKAVVLVGLIGKIYHILYAWVRQEGIQAACEAHLQMATRCPSIARHYYEANFIQDMHTDTYNEISEKMGVDNIIREDKQRKDNKQGRIESLSPLFAYGNVMFSSKQKDSPDMKRLIEQFLGFPFTADDAPDAVHGAISYLRTLRAGGKTIAKTGRYKKNNNRRG